MKSLDGSMQTLQIGMTASRKHMSGTDRYFQDLLRELPNLGIGVRGMVIGEPQAVEDPVAGIETFAAEGQGRIARIRGARRVAARLMHGANLVVSHGAPHAFYVLDKMRDRPLVVHFHGPWALEGREDGLGSIATLVRRTQEAAVYARASRFIVLSHAFADTLQREYGVDPSRVRIIPGGIDLQRFRIVDSRSQARERLQWPIDRPTVVATRRLEATKGIGALIEAIATVRQSIPSLHLVLSGTGALAGSLRGLVTKMKLEENVTFLGHVANADMPLVYRAADVSIVPSNALEGFGLSVVESLACGTPALVTPVGGLPEVVQDLDASLVLPDASVASIAEGLRHALASPSNIPSMEACVDYAQRFAWSTIARRIADVYREVA